MKRSYPSEVTDSIIDALAGNYTKLEKIDYGYGKGQYNTVIYKPLVRKDFANDHWYYVHKVHETTRLLDFYQQKANESEETGFLPKVDNTRLTKKERDLRDLWLSMVKTYDRLGNDIDIVPIPNFDSIVWSDELRNLNNWQSLITLYYQITSLSREELRVIMLKHEYIKGRKKQNEASKNNND